MGKIKVAVEKVLSENSATIPNGRRAGYNPLERKTISAATLQQDLASTGGVNDRLFIYVFNYLTVKYNVQFVQVKSEAGRN